MTSVAALLALPHPAFAGPTGGNVVAGQATISSSGNTTNINQSSNNAIINWQTFSIGSGQTVNFFQPSASSATLNRVIGNEQSIIAGALNANGQVFIVNSGGVLFTKGAQVNAGGLVASTLDMSNQNFMAGNYTFYGNSDASIVNKGHIHAKDGGYVALLGKTVENDGVISAKLGTVAMASGDKITLNFGGNSLVDVTIDKGTMNALVSNKRLIKADGGTVIMTAKAADQILSSQVNNSGIIQARTMASLTGGSGTPAVHVGAIKLLASGGTVKVTGKLDASAPKGGQGGTIETSGDKVTVANNAVITTKSSTGQNGTWTIDPDGFTIAATGGDITGTTLSGELDNGNVTILSTQGSGNGGTNDGNINVNAAVAWYSNTILTIDATNNININASISATGASAGLVLNYGGYAATPSNVAANTGYTINTANGAYVMLSGANASLTINGQTYTLIDTMAELAAINGSGGYFALGQDINASGTSYSGAVVSSFTGTLAGLGNNISNLTITDTAGNGLDGLIGTLGSSTNNSALVRDLGLISPQVNVLYTLGGNAAAYEGALIGANYGTISNSYATNVTVSGAQEVGGLVGVNWVSGNITNSSVNGTSSTVTFAANVNSPSNLGGLVGENEGAINASSSDATVIVTKVGGAGGLVGLNYGGTITNSHADGAVTGTNAGSLGGLVGVNENNGNAVGTITGSWATGAISTTYTTSGAGGTDYGGLVGNNASGSLSNDYATGNVTVTAYSASSAETNIGGLVGANSGTISGTVTNGVYTTYATGNVTSYVGSTAGTGGNIMGGLVGSNSGTGVINTTAAYGNVNGGTAGGLVGNNASQTVFATGQTVVGSISNSNAYGNVTGTNSSVADYSGGLAAENSGHITNSNAYGTVSGKSAVGGLVGYNSSASGQIASSNAYGNVSGTGTWVGGLVGYNASGGSINLSSSSGTVTGTTYTGGLVGYNSSATITNSSTSSNVTGTSDVGGLLGYDTGTTSTVSGNQAVGSYSGSGTFIGGYGSGLIGDQVSGTVSNNNYQYDPTQSSFNARAAVDAAAETTAQTVKQTANQQQATDLSAQNTFVQTQSQTATQQTSAVISLAAQKAAAILAARQAAAQLAAAQQSAATAATASTTTDTALAADEPPTPFASASGGTQAILSLTPPLIDDLLPTAPPLTTPLPTAERREHRHAANTTRHGNGGGGGGTLGATIRNIEINGQKFNLGH